LNETEAATTRSGPLAGVKILELSWVILGPFCGQLLGDHGAEIIKIESLDGDTLRDFGPRRSAQMGPSFLQANRGKKSMSLDLKQASSREIVMRLVKWCDVLVSNLRPKALARLGLDYESVRSLNKRLVYVNCTGFLEEGPYAGKPAFDEILQAMSGLALARARPEDGMPQSIPMPIADRYTGLYAAFSICAALYAAARRGEGQRLEIPMFEVMAQLTLADHMSGALFEPPLSPPGYKRYLDGSRAFFRTQDNFICATINTDNQWRAFLKALDSEELISADVYRSQSTRADNAAEVDKFLRAQFSRRSTADWLDLLQTIEVPASRVCSLEDLVNDVHLNAVGFFQKFEHPTEGLLNMPGYPTRWSATPLSGSMAAPRVGQHTGEILRELGFTQEEIDEMARRGALRSDA
jgi:crotonobetainyl-CoA:carnitine CoA-transferase CaiB-like acyl-CoA transferase